MPRTHRPAALVVALCLGLAPVPSVCAAGARPDAGVVSGSSLVQLLWDQARCWVGLKAFCGPRATVGVPQKWGCTVDPSGRCAEINCGMDPNGQCKVAAPLDRGCTIDPSGRCLPAAAETNSVDRGCTIDPNGQCTH